MAGAKKLIQNKFPHLQTSDFKLTSRETDQYNCIGWAAGTDTQWWWPGVGYYWPAGVPRAETLPSFIQAFGTIGYAVCADGAPRTGFEKLAIYADAASKPTHAARLLNDGKWTSKLGDYKDISHRTLFGLEGAIYGTVAQFMERPIR